MNTLDLEDCYYEEDVVSNPKVIASEGIDVYTEMMNRFKFTSGMAINELPGQNRLIYVDQADYNTLHIYFDSKLGLGDDKCRLDVMDLITNEKLSFKSIINIYTAVVEPHRALMESDYFLKLIEMCEFTRDQEIEAIESGTPIETGEQAPLATEEEPLDELIEEELDPLVALSNAEYLKKTVLPILYQGMKIVTAERPTDPLKYLSLYLLKNQDLINKEQYKA